MSAARVAGVVLLLAVAAPASARADAVSAAEFRSLARTAANGPTALARLRRVDSVDGRRVDVGGALAGARGPALAARLRGLAAPADARAGGDPRAAARDVLSEGRFHQSSVPRPFRSFFERIGRAVPSLDDFLPGGRSVVWVVLAGVFAALAVVVSRRVLTRRVHASVEATGAALAARDDPRALDRLAEAAEAAGDLETALRLRFRAGLLRLDAHGAIDFRPSISTLEVRRALRSDDFDALAATFDDVVYGGRPPGDADLAAARDRWPAIVKESA